jgi:hypothetical protein
MGGAIGLGGLLAGAAGGYLAYSAVDSFRDPNLISDDPEFLKQQAEIAASEEQRQAVGDQIAAQKKDLKLQAGASAAAIGGAAVGVAVTKKVAQSAVVKTVKSKVWDLFVKFVSKRAPTLAAKLGARLVAAGALATVPLLGWVGTAINLGLAAWLAYDLYTLWREFSALSDAEKALAANGNGPSSKAVNDWAYSVFIGKAQLENVPDQYKEEVKSILKKPPSNWKKKKETASGQMAPAAPNIKQPEKSVDDQISAGLESFATKATQSLKETTGSAWKAISGGVSSAYGATKDLMGFGGDGSSASASDLGKYVRLKDGSVDINGLNPQMKTRLAGLSKEYYEQTGKKIQLNSGYRSPEEQAKLYAKLGPPKAAPPGRSRHESGLAIDMNSADANKAIELGLMKKYGFTRPVRGETWHVEPIETAKRGGSPDNPYKPGAPVAVANKGGDVVSPESGKIPQSLGPGMSAGSAESTLASSDSFTSSETRTETSNDGSAQVTVTRSSSTTIGTAPKGDQPVWLDSGPNWLDAKQKASDLKPQVSTNGEGLRAQSVGLEDSKMQLQSTPPPVVNNIQTGGSSVPPIIPKSPAPKATTRPQDSSFMRALAKDFAHPTAFTTVSMV